MKLALSLGLSTALSTVSAPVYTAPFASIDADGAFATYAATPPAFNPDVSPVYTTLTRQGYDASGNTTSHSENIVITSRKRDVYPNQANPSPFGVALSQVVYSTDTAAGSPTNNSTQASPLPIANFTSVDRKLVGNSLTVEVEAYHYNYRAGKPVACVVFTCTDGNTTLTQTVSALTVSSQTGDAAPVQVYAATFDLSSLLDNVNLTVNAKVYPWIGAVASVADSSLNSAGTRTFCPQVYRRNTSRFNSPPIIVIDPAGNDTTGGPAFTQGGADASPVLTLNGAWTRARAVLGTTAGSLDGLIIQGKAGTWELTASPTANTTNCDVIYTRHSSATRATAIFGFGTGNFTQGATYMRCEDCTTKRSGAFSFTMPTSGFSTWRNVTFDANSQASTQYWTQNHRIDGGVTVINPSTGGNLYSAGTHTLMLCRGLTYGGTNTNWQVDGYHVTGCDLSGVAIAYGTRSASNSIVSFNKLMKMGNASGDEISVGTTADVTGFAMVQNVFEWTSASATQGVGLSRDSQTANLTHIVIWHNTHTGFYSAGRHNMFYDETTGTNRNHKLLSVVGNIFDQVNVKGDVYKLDGAKVGHFQALYGVGWSGNFVMFIDANSGGLGTSFAPAYPGLSSSWGSSSTVRNDPLFTNYQGTTSGPTAGAGGGTYTLSGSSPAKTIVPVSPLGFDLAGTIRATNNGTAGAYQA